LRVYYCDLQKFKRGRKYLRPVAFELLSIESKIGWLLKVGDEMKPGFGLVLLLVVFTVGYAQDGGSAAESAEKLRAQLLEVQAKEEDLRGRLQQLDESIKPENIERSLAGVGSTKPEELREARRRQLSIQRDGVLAQLQTMETSRMRLETALANAEALAYQQSARPAQTLRASGSRSQWFMFGGGGLALLALGGGGAFLYRRSKRIR
jgi:hypothetical protein